MELLQSVQYLFIDQCDNMVNKVLTIAGFAHICLQPYFTQVLNAAVMRNPTFVAGACYNALLC